MDSWISGTIDGAYGMGNTQCHAITSKLIFAECWEYNILLGILQPSVYSGESERWVVLCGLGSGDGSGSNSDFGTHLLEGVQNLKNLVARNKRAEKCSVQKSAKWYDTHF